MPNDLRFVESITTALHSCGLDVWLAGGWAEELHGLIEPRSHHDVDLLVRAESFNAVDRFLAQDGIAEIKEKRFSHKRAFEAEGTMVELILIDPDLTTTFWGEHRYRWPSDTFSDQSGAPRIASVAALHHYRNNRPPKQPATRSRSHLAPRSLWPHRMMRLIAGDMGVVDSPDPDAPFRPPVNKASRARRGTLRSVVNREVPQLVSMDRLATAPATP